MLKLSVYRLSLISAVVIASSCGPSKELLGRVARQPKEMVDLPVDYANKFPSLALDRWDHDYNLYSKFLTSDIKATQMGLSYETAGVETWWCYPSALTHVQLDTATMIQDNKTVVGDWRIVSNRKISYRDSVVYADNKIYRSDKVMYDEKGEDVVLVITPDKFNLYSKGTGKSSFKSAVNRKYRIESKRFLMLYRMTVADAAISFIGIDKEGRLLVNSYFVQENKVKGKYIAYNAVMTQLVFRRI